eukprot:scaffold24992_cov43-Cyclotella_meneghiniana.AAC.2
MVLLQWARCHLQRDEVEVAPELRFSGGFFAAETTEARPGAAWHSHLSHVDMYFGINKKVCSPRKRPSTQPYSDLLQSVTP